MFTCFLDQSHVLLTALLDTPPQFSPTDHFHSCLILFLYVIDTNSKVKRAGRVIVVQQQRKQLKCVKVEENGKSWRMNYQQSGECDMALVM